MWSVATWRCRCRHNLIGWGQFADLTDKARNYNVGPPHSSKHKHKGVCPAVTFFDRGLSAYGTPFWPNALHWRSQYGNSRAHSADGRRCLNRVKRKLEETTCPHLSVGSVIHVHGPAQVTPAMLHLRSTCSCYIASYHTCQDVLSAAARAAPEALVRKNCRLSVTVKPEDIIRPTVL